MANYIATEKLFESVTLSMQELKEMSEYTVAN